MRVIIIGWIELTFVLSLIRWHAWRWRFARREIIIDASTAFGFFCACGTRKGVLHQSAIWWHQWWEAEEEYLRRTVMLLAAWVASSGWWCSFVLLIAVRDAIEGQLTITNYPFTRTLMDSQSADFRQLAMAVEDSVRILTTACSRVIVFFRYITPVIDNLVIFVCFFTAQESALGECRADWKGARPHVDQSHWVPVSIHLPPWWYSRSCVMPYFPLILTRLTLSQGRKHYLHIQNIMASAASSTSVHAWVSPIASDALSEDPWRLSRLLFGAVCCSQILL